MWMPTIASSSPVHNPMKPHLMPFRRNPDKSPLTKSRYLIHHVPNIKETLNPKPLTQALSPNLEAPL